LILTKSAFVQIERGSHKNLYGQVDGLDEETARVIVRLALGGQVVSVSENVIRLVGKKEYKEFSKMLNKDSYEKFRDKQKEREEQWDRDRGQRENRSKDKEEKKQSRRSRSRSPEKKHRDSEKSSSKSSKNGSSKKREERTWLRPMLRVRIVDKNYRSGKYFNSKVVIEDVSSNESCVCRTESGAILEDVSNWRCETIIPKAEYSIVMIVRGQNRGQLAEILSRDKRSSQATLQILPDKEDIVKLDYDDICEYVGDTSHL
jgi:G patch domain/KOW motif-containing protein